MVATLKASKNGKASKASKGETIGATVERIQETLITTTTEEALATTTTTEENTAPPAPEAPTTPEQAQANAEAQAKEANARQAAERVEKDKEALTYLNAGTSAYASAATDEREHKLSAGEQFDAYRANRVAIGVDREVAVSAIAAALAPLAMEKIGTNEVNAMIRSSHAHKLLFVATGKVEEAKQIPYTMYAKALSTLISAVDLGKKTERYVILPGIESDCHALADSVCKGNHTVTSATDKARELNLTLAKNQAEEARKAKEEKEEAHKAAQAAREKTEKEAKEQAERLALAEQVRKSAEKQAEEAKDDSAREQAERQLAEMKAKEEQQRKDKVNADFAAEQAKREETRLKQEKRDADKLATNAQIRAEKGERREQERQENKGRGNGASKDKGKEEGKPACPGDYAKMSVADVAAHLFAILAKHEKPHSVLATLITHCDSAPKGTFDNATMRGIRAFIDTSKKPAVKDNGPDGASK